MENECIGCGCTDSKACVDKNAPCHWLVVDRTLGLGVCSSCPQYVEHFRSHQEEIAKAFLE